jgi:hypothetical protein
VIGSTVGIIGLGAIGQEVARRAVALGAHVVAVRRGSAGAVTPEGVTLLANVEEVVARADHIVIAVPATAQTHRMFNAQLLARTKPGAHLINARGSVVDQEALLAALDGGRLDFATLDVTEPEPLPDGHRLYTHPRVLLTPHISANYLVARSPAGKADAGSHPVRARGHAFGCGGPGAGLLKEAGWRPAPVYQAAAGAEISGRAATSLLGSRQPIRADPEAAHRQIRVDDQNGGLVNLRIGAQRGPDPALARVYGRLIERQKGNPQRAGKRIIGVGRHRKAQAMAIRHAGVHRCGADRDQRNARCRERRGQGFVIIGQSDVARRATAKAEKDQHRRTMRHQQGQRE